MDLVSNISPSGTIRFAKCYINAEDRYYSDNVSTVSIKSGALTISKSGDNYEISFNCTDYDGNTVEGQYSGKLASFDYSD